MGHSEYTPSKYRARQIRNAMSQAKALRNKEPWTPEDDAVLRREWCTDLVKRAAIAEELGRTIEACRERYSRLFGDARPAPTPEPLLPETCPTCYLAHAGECF